MGDRINWQYLLEREDTENLQNHIDDLDKTEGGRLFHNWMQNRMDQYFEDLEWEGRVENGRYDVFDGDLVYEFKTKHPVCFEEDRMPYDRDINQVNKYLESEDLDADFGVLTYVNRGDVTEVDEYLTDGTEIYDFE